MNYLGIQASSPSGIELPHSPAAQQCGRRGTRRRTGPRSKKKCFNCRKAKKKCVRPSPGQSCELCENGNYQCGQDLTLEQWKSREGRDGTQVPPLPVAQNLAANRASRSPSEGTDISESGILEVKMFSRNYSGRDPQTWWALKLGRLMNTMRNFKEIYDAPPSLEGVTNPPAHLYCLSMAWRQVLEGIEDAVEKLRELAMGELAKRNNVAAERLFLLLFDPVRDFKDLSPEIRIRALEEMASYYEEMKNQPQLQLVLGVLLKLPFSTRKYLKIKSKAQQRMARSILEAVPVACAEFANRFGINVGPPLHCPALHQAVLFGDRVVFNIILRKVCERTVAQSGRSLPPSSSRNLGVACGEAEGIDIPDTFGRTALFLAVVQKAEDLCGDLIDAGAAIQIRDFRGRTLLEMAAENGLVETIKRMLSRAREFGQDFVLNFVNDTQLYTASTALQAAAAAGHGQIVRLLLSNGAHKDAQRFCDGKTAAELAADNHHEAIAAEIGNWHYANPRDFGVSPRPERPPDPGLSHGDHPSPSAASGAVNLLLVPDTEYSMGENDIGLFGTDINHGLNTDIQRKGMNHCL